MKNLAYTYSMKKLNVYIMLFCGVLFSLPLAAQDIQMKSSVDRNPVGLNEVFTFQVELTGSTTSLPDLRLPQLADFKLLGGPNQSTSFSMVNGSVSTSKTYTMQLMPQKTGTFRIPSFQMQYKGKTYRSNALDIVVLKDSQPRQNQSRSNAAAGSSQSGASSNELFIRAVPSKRTVFINEQFNVDYKVYFRIPIRNPDFVKLPETVGFWVEEFEIPQNIPVSQEMINGVQYSVAEIKKYALFPTKAGDLSLTPMQLAVNVVARKKRRDPFNMFDSFFEDPFGKTIRKVLTTKALKIKVNPLPQEGKPENFSGLVGNFRLSDELDKNSVNANEAISLKLRISGSGNLKSLKDIPVNFPASFEIYDPKIKYNTNRSGSKFSASRELEYVLIPRTSGEYRIKPIEVAYFDPAAKRYVTLRSKEYLINVGEGEAIAGLGNSSYIPKSDVTLLGKDIHFIKEDKLDLVPMGYRPYQAGWFWASLILPALFLTFAYGYRNHVEKMSTNVEYARKKRAFKHADKRLKGANQFLKEKKYAEFYGEVSRSLLGFVADKSNQASAGLLKDDVKKILQEKAVQDTLIQEYLQCLDEADFRRFAPGEASEESAKSFYQRAAEILENLGKYF